MVTMLKKSLVGFMLAFLLAIGGIAVSAPASAGVIVHDVTDP
jgi:hypothetical protein